MNRIIREIPKDFAINAPDRKAPIINALALAHEGHIFISTFSIAQEDEEGLKISRPHEGSYRRYADTEWV